MNLSPKADAAQRFRAALLQPTLQNAIRTDFYKSLWSDVPVAEITLDTLHQLPLVEKEAIKQAGTRAQNREGLICTEIFTSGTTGVPLVTVRGNREQEYIRSFFKQSLGQLPPKGLLRGLQFNNPYHGSHVSVPAPIHFHQVGIYDNGSFEHARKVLTGTHYDAGVEPHCTVLVGLERCLRAFTWDTRLLFPEGFPCHLKSVVSYSQYLTRQWRRIMQETWGCQVIDRFSLSEIFGGAIENPGYEWWTFDPFVIPEVVTADLQTVLKEGVGLLVLTALYPFQEAQPMIRYLTGDLVAVTHTQSPKPGELAIRPLGRARYGVPLPGSNEWLLTPAAIYEAIDDISEIKRIPRFQDSDQVKDPLIIGHPKYSVTYTNEADFVKITVHCEVKQSVIAERGDEVKQRLLHKLLLNSETLVCGLQSGKASLNIEFASNFEVNLIAHSA